MNSNACTKFLVTAAAAVMALGVPFAASAQTTKHDIVVKNAVVAKSAAPKTLSGPRAAANDLTRTVRADITSQPQPFSGSDLTARGPVNLAPNFQRGFNQPPVSGSPYIAGPYIIPTGPSKP
jgi:hypothetical protein